VQMSVRHGNNAKDSLRGFQIARVLCANLAMQARARACFPKHGPTWAGFSPILFIIFPFSFSARLGKFIESSRKMLKIWDQFS
jgi:hypothetical protein